ncbi:MAG: hypothetical protein LBV71_12760 [Prevotella sp.]|jgi:hypothetical protein|nr:hypothetical protein [Prevotella sp.]
MENEFSYYIIEPNITERTPLLMNKSGMNPEGINFLYYDRMVSDDYIAYLQFLMPLKNPDMDTDYLVLEGNGVFSGKIKNALIKHMPIRSLQLVEAVINENNAEYKDFWIANIYNSFSLFDEELSEYDDIDDEMWFGIEKIVLSKERLTKIPLEERLVFEAAEDCAFTLYHESIVDIIKSVDPKGMHFIPVEEWRG